jgi:hypothetical protein
MRPPNFFPTNPPPACASTTNSTPTRIHKPKPINATQQHAPPPPKRATTADASPQQGIEIDELHYIFEFDQ